MFAHLAFFLLDGIKNSRNAVSDLLLEKELAKTDREQDANGGKHQI